MLTAIETFDLSQILQPAQSPEFAEQDAGQYAPSTTFFAGQALSQKTTDKLLYPLVPGNSDGTQLFVGFAMYSFLTDANGLGYFGTAPMTATPSVRQGPWMTAPFWKTGIFDPQDLRTKATPTGEVNTFTPAGTITTGDVNTITFTGGPGNPTTASFTVGATTTAAAVSAGLIAAWNNNPVLKALGTASGSSTFIVTSVNAGTPLNLTSAVTGVGTLTKATTTAAAGRSIADIQVARPSAYVMHNGFWNV